VVARANPNPYFTTGAVPLIPVQEQSTGLRYRGTAIGRISDNDLLYGRTVASFVTGAHSFKGGFVYGEIPNDDLTFTLDAPMTGTFVATVNADMNVGAVEETITVTGETPIVDVQSTTREQEFDQEILEALPSSRAPQRMAALLPGA
jgi:hypothetical protein